VIVGGRVGEAFASLTDTWNSSQVVEEVGHIFSFEL